MRSRDPRRWKALAIVCAAFFMTVLDVSIVNVALPSIGEALALLARQPAVGHHRLRDHVRRLPAARRPRRRPARTAADVPRRRRGLHGRLVPLRSRLVRRRADRRARPPGLGAAIISPAALSIITTTFEEGAERNKALGIWGAIGGGGAAVGVLAGGVLTKYLGWEWIFFVNVPVGVIAFLLAPRFVRESRVERESTPDVAGAVTVTAGLALLVYAVSKAPTRLGLELDDLAARRSRRACSSRFLVIEARAKDPLMPFAIFRVRTVAGANVAGLLLGAVTFSNFFLLTLYVQHVLGWSALKTGVTFVATAGTRRALGGGRAGARHADRREDRDASSASPR